MNTIWVIDARIKVKISPLRSIPTSREDLSKAKGEWKVELSQVPRLGRGLVLPAAR